MTGRKIDYAAAGKSLGKAFALAAMAVWGGSQTLDSVLKVSGGQESVAAKLDTLIASQYVMNSKIEALSESDVEMRLELRAVSRTLDSMRIRESIEAEYAKRYREAMLRNTNKQDEVSYAQR